MGNGFNLVLYQYPKNTKALYTSVIQWTESPVINTRSWREIYATLDRKNVNLQKLVETPL